jgi:hypothetical protein
MGLVKGQEGLFAGAVGTGDTVQIDLDIAGAGAAPRDGTRQTVCPFPNQLPG